nr:MAG TPA: hypothetical protein [Caudoviricetes sp.]
MICTVKYKLCPTGDGAEFSNEQFITIDRILIQNVVLFKIFWFARKVIIYGIIYIPCKIRVFRGVCR